MGFDPAHDHSFDSMVFAIFDKKANSLKHLLTQQLYRALDLETFAPNSHIKEAPRMTTRLRIPTDTVERRDISAALRALGEDVDTVLNMIAVVQDLEEGEMVRRIDHLNKDDVVGKYLTVIDGEADGTSGWCTDFSKTDRDGLITAILDGQIVKVHYRTYVIISQDTGKRIDPVTGLSQKTPDA